MATVLVEKAKQAIHDTRAQLIKAQSAEDEALAVEPRTAELDQLAGAAIAARKAAQTRFDEAVDQLMRLLPHSGL